MAYTKHNWECNELIHADDLNHMEQGIEDANSHFSCSEDEFPYYSGQLTATFDSAENKYKVVISEYDILDADAALFTINGTTYRATPRYRLDGKIEYIFGYASSDPDPLYKLVSDYNEQILYVPSAGTYNISIVRIRNRIYTSRCFQKAVAECIDLKGLAYINIYWNGNGTAELFGNLNGYLFSADIMVKEDTLVGENLADWMLVSPISIETIGEVSALPDDYHMLVSRMIVHRLWSLFGKDCKDSLLLDSVQGYEAFEIPAYYYDILRTANYQFTVAL